MPSNTKLLQAMADTMLPLFGDLPRVMVHVRDDASFHQERAPLAVYDAPDIVVNPDHPRTSSFSDMKATICHELIHAWLSWNNLDNAGEFLDEHHNEWFVKKALEINRLNIDGLHVSVEFLLTNPEAVRIYNRLAETERVPREPENTIPRKAPVDTYKQVHEIFGWGGKDYTWYIVIGVMLITLVTLYFKRPMAGYVFIAFAIIVFLYLGFEFWRELFSRMSRKKTSPAKSNGDVAE